MGDTVSLDLSSYGDGGGGSNLWSISGSSL